MKPPVSSSPCANEHAQRKAPVIQCSVTGEPIGTCAKPAVPCQTQWNRQANTACEGGALQVDNLELRQNGQVGTSPGNGAERLNTNEVDVSGRLSTSPADDAAAVGTGEDQQGDEADVNSEYADEELAYDEDEDLDDQLEAAYCAGRTVDSNDDDNSPAEDWETEIVPPTFIVPEKAYLYGKKVFVPSDFHAPTTRRRSPQFNVVQGQFDDADT
uniref:Uncharacterized protein n=1 Tax=Rhipicephalus pulchellus TaxID=72859 RepID=L7LV37_RHIPC